MKHTTVIKKCEEVIAEYELKINEIEEAVSQVNNKCTLPIKERTLSNRSLNIQGNDRVMGGLVFRCYSDDSKNIHVDPANFNWVHGITINKKKAIRLRNYLNLFIAGR